MSRISDTRVRTREAATHLVAAGRRPHALTVDLIYAEIKQGSRTTINDELKLWKDEQAKVDALNAALPPVVANAMLAVWAVAVEQGENAFTQRQEEVEGELTQALECVQDLETRLAAAHEDAATLRTQLEARQANIDALRADAAMVRTAADTAQARAQALEDQLESVRREAEHRLAETKTEQQQRVAALQAAMTAQEQAFRDELDKATTRLEGVQQHVLRQVTDAREATARAEARLAKAQQTTDERTAEVQQLRTRLADQSQQYDRAQSDLARLSQAADQWRAERESLIQQLARLTGTRDAQAAQIDALERRAVGAETRLEAALKRPVAIKTAAKADQMERS
ncbi:DNA-binding protein [uncultured Thiodictyon sp.]|uniref:DNA-binding protein n=1 Tax=uncultured Thiodictyon sp. TaxID=1846217 RepID=UPI0025EC9C24|nr:DNA-binding protein [uncultured Thiodictyon sp.]